MPYLDEIRIFVHGLPELGSARAAVDVHALGRAVFEALEEAERAGRNVEDALAWWQLEGVVGAFFNDLARRLGELAGEGLSAQDLERSLRLAARWAVLRDEAEVRNAVGGSFVRASQLSTAALAALDVAGASKLANNSINRHYCSELGLISRAPGGWAATQAGRVLVAQTSSNARRWLLHLEVRQSLGPEDPWRVHQSLLRTLRDKGETTYFFQPQNRGQESLWPWETLVRMARYGVVDQENFGNYEDYSLRRDARPLLDELLADPPVPMALLAEALSRDVQDRALEPWISPAVSSHGSENLLAARMVAHEIRNAVVPLRTALRGLLEDSEEGLAPQRLKRTLDRADDSLLRVLNFVGDQLEMAELGLPPQAPFSLPDAIAAAIRETEAERNGRISVEVSADLPDLRLSGVRHLFVGAMVNLIRNAAQARPQGKGRIHVHGSMNQGRLRLIVDDDGPGVVPAERERIFERGLSLRDGGGEGLALVRTVVLDLRGTIVCEQAPEGGARFSIDLPVPRRTE